MTWLRIILILFFGVVISCQNQNTTKTEIESNTTVNYPCYSNDTLAYQGVILEKGPWQQAANTTTPNLFSDRATGFPRLVRHQDFLYLANTKSHSDKTTEIALSSWPMSLMLPRELTLGDE